MILEEQIHSAELTVTQCLAADDVAEKSIHRDFARGSDAALA